MVREHVDHRRPAQPATDLRDAVANARVVLLDFDGPICSIFAGHPAPAVAE